ncbi:MAG TPA: caspase family protein [Ardenticatenaceae bacterium]|nr:caspase family protein [Ardenticatenaceae bacterium]
MPFDQGHALLIGVGSYVHAPRIDIPISVGDAQAVGDVLPAPNFCGYPPEQVQLLHDATATRDGILAALDGLAARTNPESTVLLFYCGHGAYGDDGEYYLTSHDTRVKAGKVATGSGVSHAQLLEKLARIPARRLLLLFNACHSGEISPTFDTEETLPDFSLPATTAEALLSTGEGRIIVAACREEQKSYFVRGAPVSIFTQALLDGLRGKGTTNHRGFISAFDLYTHLYYAVTEEVVRRYQVAQEPELTVLKGLGPFAVSLYRGATSLGVFDDQEALPEGTAAREVSPQRSRRRYQQIQRSVVNTGGGAYISGNVHVGGDFVGRDKITYGDEVRGNKVGGDKIRVGDITGSQGVAIGRAAAASVSSGLRGEELGLLFAAIYRQIEAGPDRATMDKDELRETVKRVETEVAKGEQANADRVARWLRTLADAAPDILDVTVTALLNPAAGVAAVIRLAAEKVRSETR